MSRLPFASLALVALLAGSAVVPLACGAGSGSEGSGSPGAGGTHGAVGTGTGSGGNASTGSLGQGGVLLGDSGIADFTSLEISPKDPTLEILNGVVPAATKFEVMGVTAAKAKVPIAGSWSFDRYDLGTIGQTSGALATTGLLGGTGTVTVTSGKLKATTSVTVKLHFTSDPQGVVAPIKASFGAASKPDASLVLLYPYDKTVFPRGLTGPTIQWNGGAATDVYYVRAVSPTFEFEGWGTVPPPSQYVLPTMLTDVWRKLTDSTTGDLSLSVQRYDGVNAYLPVTETWTIASANLAGTIYYWSINSGSVVRIKPGDAQPTNFVQLAPGHTCVACHSVSKDGSTMVAAYDGGASPWATFDPTTGAQLYFSAIPSGFEAISPNGKYVLWRQWTDSAFDTAGYLSLSKSGDATELAQLAAGGGAPAHPAWSGDATKVAFSVRTDGTGLDFTTANLWITDVNLATSTFSNTVQIVANDPARTVVTYPTFSPDSKWVAFERSTQARSRGAQSDVWLSTADGAVTIPLDQTNGVGHLTGPEVSSTYEPTFMPVSVGGYFWLVVVSERTYGNTLTVTDPASRLKQLWVTAIDASPAAGKDPSHPAFYLPGQGATNNMRGEWALDPCKKLGNACQAGYECCDGFCHTDDAGMPVCSNQPQGCSGDGDKCVKSADCCDPKAICSGGFCSPVAPK